MGRLCALAVFAFLLTGAKATAALPRVTVVGDSVMAAVWWHEQPLALLAHGFDVQWDVAVCRTVAGESCPYEGSRPPTLLDLVGSVGAGLGGTVVVELGYNDPESTFPQEIDDAVNALVGVGVAHVLWLTLHEQLPAFAAMNGDLRAAALSHPQLSIVDWNAATAGHPDWFQDDGIHLSPDGADALATVVNDALAGAFAPPPPPAAAPAVSLFGDGVYRYATSRSRG